MSDIVIDAPVLATTIEAELNYLEFTGEKPVSYQYDPPPGVPKRSGVYRAHRVSIANARVAPPPGVLSIDRNGFELHRHASALSDFSDPAKIESVYYPEAERLLKQATGARRVVVFDHTLRDGNPERGNGIREPVKYIHNDQTFVSGPRRVRDHLPAAEAERLLKGAWRSSIYGARSEKRCTRRRSRYAIRAVLRSTIWWRRTWCIRTRLARRMRWCSIRGTAGTTSRICRRMNTCC